MMFIGPTIYRDLPKNVCVVEKSDMNMGEWNEESDILMEHVRYMKSVVDGLC